MLNKLDIYKLFLISILISPFLGYFSSSGIIAYSPIIISMSLIIIMEILQPTKMATKEWGAVLIWLPYVCLASYYYISNPLDGRYLTTHLLAIITLPIVTLSLLQMYHNSLKANFPLFLYKILRFFLIAELVICLGQISTYSLGIGLPINEIYKDYFMITGTFYNSNDLGAVVLLIAFLFINIENNHTLRQQGFIWLLIISLLLISGSRAALFTTGLLFIITRKVNTKNIFFYSLVFIFLFIAYTSFFLDSDNSVVSRFTSRVESLLNVLKNGVGSDGSMGLRLDSYIHFIKNLDQLGLGSGKINDYYQYAENTNFNNIELMFQNPHSLIVELGYWLGWPGLIFFSIAIIYLLQYSNKKITLILVIIIASSIPSSILGNLIFITLILLNVFNKKHYDN